MTVDAWVEDIPDNEKPLPLQNKVGIEDSEAAGSITATTMGGMLLKKDAGRTTLNEATVKNSKALGGDISASSGMGKVSTEEQMEKGVEVGALREEIREIKEEIKDLKKERKEAEEKCENTKVDELKKRYLNDIEEISKKITRKEERIEKYEDQIDNIHLKGGKEKESKEHSTSSVSDSSAGRSVILNSAILCGTGNKMG